MKVAVTGATGFLGRYIVRQLLQQGHTCRCWFRPKSQRDGMDERIEWCEGSLGDRDACHRLVTECDAVVHSGLFRAGAAFRGGEGDVADFVQQNVVGTIQLIESARAANADRFVFVSTCAVHERIREDRPLDEAHPLVALSHYGAHKAAVEQFVHSYGFGFGYPICAVRPTGIYGVAQQPERSKWFDLVQSVVRGDSVTCSRGGKEVHAADVATAIDLLLHADDVSGEVYSCYDQYVSEWEVAHLAKEISGSDAKIEGQQTEPKHQIVSDKIRTLGMQFGGPDRLKQTVQQLVDHCR